MYKLFFPNFLFVDVNCTHLIRSGLIINLIKMNAPAGLPITGSIQCQKMSCQNGKMEPPVLNEKYECWEAHLVYFSSFTSGLPFGSIIS